MRLLSILISFFLSFTLTAQPAINFDLYQAIGNEWGQGSVDNLPVDSFPSTLIGENLNWDFTFLGNMDNGHGTPFSQALKADFEQVKFQGIDGLTLDVGGVAQDSFPTAVGVILVGNDTNDYDQVFVIGQNDEGIVRLGELQDYGEEDLELDERDSFFLYPTNLGYGEIKELETLNHKTDANSNDSLTYTDIFTYIGHGTTKMYYGDVPNTILYQQKNKSYYRSYDINNGGLIFENYYYRISYLFVQNGNMIPLMIYSYDTGQDWTPTNGGGNNLYVYVPFFDVINEAAEIHENAIDLTVFPNPVVGRQILLNYHLDGTSSTNIALFAPNGQKLMDWGTSIKRAGLQTETFNLPSNLSNGSYILKLTAGNSIATEKIIIGE